MTPEFLKLNPSGKVPVLLVELPLKHSPPKGHPDVVVRPTPSHETLVMSQSVAIMEFLEEAFPRAKRKLLPFSLIDRQKVMSSIMTHMSLLCCAACMHVGQTNRGIIDQ